MRVDRSELENLLETPKFEEGKSAKKIDENHQKCGRKTGKKFSLKILKKILRSFRELTGQNVKSCLGQVSGFKLGSFASKQCKCRIFAQTLLLLKAV